jgi:UDP-N-acetylmuramate: L-alanyl-gamma-D-glutamyl-meso-diaminopimelate ligase
MKLHFIAIGGSAMHNLAIALHKKGITVTGSDDEIFEPSKSRLAKYGLLPTNEGWDENNITKDIDAVILGMHARLDNPELIKAQQLGIKIYSYPEYLYEASKDKIRIVIGGSHGKTTITSMIIHVFNALKINCDYMVGAQLQGFEVMVKLTDTAKYIIIEGDEYLTSPIDRRPKFHLYMPDIALISGIAWDHINVFPTFENYIEQFKIFTDLITEKGKLIYCTDDTEVLQLAKQARKDIQLLPYAIPEHIVKDDVTNILFNNTSIPLQIFGNHNLMNLNGARLVCKQVGISDVEFYKAIQSFQGASKRLELVKMNDFTNIYKDFAHSPSKLKATTSAVKAQFKERKLTACMELHTFSSLTQAFLMQYKDSMNEADEAIVYYNPHTLEHKKLPALSIEDIKNAFNREDLLVFTDSTLLINHLENSNWKLKNLLMMSSGNFDGINFNELANLLIK